MKMSGCGFTLALAGAVLAAQSITINLARETVGTEPKTLLPMAGDWLIRADGAEKVVIVDGRLWQSGQPSARFADRARAIFGAQADVFIEKARAFALYALALAQGVDELHNGEIGLKFKILSGTLGRSGGVVFGVRPTGDYLTVQFVGAEGALALWTFHDGERRFTARGHETTPLAMDVWHDLKVVVTGTALEGWLNGKHLLDHVLAEPVSGKIGLGSEGDAVIAFKDITVTPR